MRKLGEKLKLAAPSNGYLLLRKPNLSHEVSSLICGADNIVLVHLMSNVRRARLSRCSGSTFCCDYRLLCGHHRPALGNLDHRGDDALIVVDAEPYDRPVRWDFA